MKGKQGQASQSPERRSEIARQGGRAAAQTGRVYYFTDSDAAKAARHKSRGNRRRDDPKEQPQES